MSKRKTYRPKFVDTNPLARLMPATGEIVNITLAKFDSALYAMRAGNEPSVNDWRLLADCVNTLETLTHGKTQKLIADEMREVLAEANAGMLRARNRYLVGKGLRLDAQGLTALCDCIAIYRQCAEGLTAREMMDAQRETARRVAEAQMSGKGESL